MRERCTLAYADPPYPGQAKLYEGGTEVDHRELVQRLTTYDGWALSTSSTALRDVLALCPPGVRVGSWVKGFAAFKRNVSPAYAWEPVIFSPARKWVPGITNQTARDWVYESATLKKGLCGAKPRHFCEWLFGLLGALPGDSLDDLFLGTGAVTEAWKRYAADEWLPPRALSCRSR